VGRQGPLSRGAAAGALTEAACTTLWRLCRAISRALGAGSHFPGECPRTDIPEETACIGPEMQAPALLHWPYRLEGRLAGRHAVSSRPVKCWEYCNSDFSRAIVRISQANIKWLRACRWQESREPASQSGRPHSDPHSSTSSQFYTASKWRVPGKTAERAAKQSGESRHHGAVRWPAG
jgi:hypothetical protein